MADTKGRKRGGPHNYNSHRAKKIYEQLVRNDVELSEEKKGVLLQDEYKAVFNRQRGHNQGLDIVQYGENNGVVAKQVLKLHKKQLSGQQAQFQANQLGAEQAESSSLQAIHEYLQVGPMFECDNLYMLCCSLWHFGPLTNTFWRPIVEQIVNTDDYTGTYEYNEETAQLARERLLSQEPAQMFQICGLPYIVIDEQGGTLYGALKQWCGEEDDGRMVNDLFYEIRANKYNRAELARRLFRQELVDPADLAQWSNVQAGWVFANPLAKPLPRRFLIVPPHKYVTFVFGVNFEQSDLMINGKFFGAHVWHYDCTQQLCYEAKNLATRDPLIYVCNSAYMIISTEHYGEIEVAQGRNSESIPKVSRTISHDPEEINAVMVGFLLDYVSKVVANNDFPLEWNSSDVEVLRQSHGHVLVLRNSRLPDPINKIVAKSRWASIHPNQCSSIPLGPDQIVTWTESS